MSSPPPCSSTSESPPKLTPYSSSGNDNCNQQSFSDGGNTAEGSSDNNNNELGSDLTNSIAGANDVRGTNGAGSGGNDGSNNNGFGSPVGSEDSSNSNSNDQGANGGESPDGSNGFGQGQGRQNGNGDNSGNQGDFGRPSSDGGTGGSNNQQIPSGSNSNFITYNIPSLKIKMQAPAEWQGPTSCDTTDSSGMINIPTTCKNLEWTSQDGNSHLEIHNQNILAIAGIHWDQMPKAIKKVINILHFEYVALKEGTLNGVNPIYVARYDEKSPFGSSIWHEDVYIGTSNNMPWLEFAFSANPAAYLMSASTIAKIIGSISPADNTSDNSNAQLPPSLSIDRQQPQQQEPGGEGDNGGDGAANNNQVPGGRDGNNNNNQQQEPDIPLF